MSDLLDRSRLMRPDDPAAAEVVLKAVEQIAAQEMHFNKLCADFKKMASTWLLATFGGIGFLATSDFDIGIDRFLLIGLVAAAGAIGIYLLWVVDLLIYQRLLSSAFVWRGRIEAEHPWLPQIYDTMAERIFARNVSFNLAWFYMLSVLVPAAIAVAALTYTAIEATGRPWPVLAVAAVVLLLLRRMLRVSTPEEAKDRR